VFPDLVRLAEESVAARRHRRGQRSPPPPDLLARHSVPKALLSWPGARFTAGGDRGPDQGEVLPHGVRLDVLAIQEHLCGIDHLTIVRFAVRLTGDQCLFIAKVQGCRTRDRQPELKNMAATLGSV
jgi:hypothetical protein